MKSFATIVLLASIQIISTKKWSNNNVLTDNYAEANANSLAINAGFLGDANAKSNAYATNVNVVDQRIS